MIPDIRQRVGVTWHSESQSLEDKVRLQISKGRGGKTVMAKQNMKRKECHISAIRSARSPFLILALCHSWLHQRFPCDPSESNRYLLTMKFPHKLLSGCSALHVFQLDC